MFVFIFRRDYRLDDNLGLIECLKRAKEQDKKVLPIFIYNKAQIESGKNPYFSNNAMQFLVESIRDLESQIKEKGGTLHKFIVKDTDEEIDILKSITPAVSHVYTNMDLTPYARQRDDKLQKNLKMKEISFRTIGDYTLFKMDEPKTKTAEGTTYQIHSYLYKKIGKLHDIIPKVNHLSSSSSLAVFMKAPIKGVEKKYIMTSEKESSLYKKNDELSVHGGREQGIKRLKALEKGEFKKYDMSRDEMAREEGTTRLSAYLKYGCLSIREVYWTAFDAYGLKNPINRELFFREFYYNIVWSYPRVLEGMKTKKNKKNKNQSFNDIDIEWRSGKEANRDLEAWKKGKTGVPMVDAGMRQLNTTGFMHNRARMLTSMFLVRDLLLDWRWGERYFATQLVDYDPSQNNAGWMWSSGLAPYATPYYRTMNPYTQQRRFDKEAKYIKKWVPELEDVDPKDIEKWEEEKTRTLPKYKDIGYPKPIIEDHTERIRDVERIYKKAYMENKK